MFSRKDKQKASHNPQTGLTEGQLPDAGAVQLACELLLLERHVVFGTAPFAHASRGLEMLEVLIERGEDSSKLADQCLDEMKMVRHFLALDGATYGLKQRLIHFVTNSECLLEYCMDKRTRDLDLRGCLEDFSRALIRDCTIGGTRSTREFDVNKYFIERYGIS